MTTAFINRIETAVPATDVHELFIDFVQSQLRSDNRRLALFRRMVDKGGIDHRYSCLERATDPGSLAMDVDGLFVPGRFPNTAKRMRLFDRFAPALAAQAVDRLRLGEDKARVSHLIVTCCTGFSAPGLDLEIVERCGLSPSVERTIVGFMGCYAAINALKLARHIVRSEPTAKVLVVNLELCTLHLKETPGPRAAPVLPALRATAARRASSPRSREGVAIDSFQAVLAPDTRYADHAGTSATSGFDMVLSGKVPASIHDALSREREAILEGAVDGRHRPVGGPSGRAHRARRRGARLAARAERSCGLARHPAAVRQHVFRDGDVRARRAVRAPARAQRGCAMAFGPGLVAETMLFRTGR